MNRNSNETGKLLKSYLETGPNSTTLSSLAHGASTTRVHMSRVVNGHNIPSAEWLNLVAGALGLSDPQRVALHRAAARDNGFEIDLT